MVPVLGGVVVLAAIFGATWAIAAWNARSDAEPTTRLAPRTLPVGRVESVAATITEMGPILFPGLNTTTGERTLILDHQGDDPTRALARVPRLPRRSRSDLRRHAGPPHVPLHRLQR